MKLWRHSFLVETSLVVWVAVVNLSSSDPDVNLEGPCFQLMHIKLFLEPVLGTGSETWDSLFQWESFKLLILIACNPIYYYNSY